MPVPQGLTSDLIDDNIEDQHILIESLLELIQLLQDFTNNEIEADETKVKESLAEQLPKIANYYLEEINKPAATRDLSDEFINNIFALQKLIYKHFLECKNRNLIDILLANQISPISEIKINSMINEVSHERVMAATTIQRHYRSALRKRLHFSIFNKQGQYSLSIPKNMRDYKLSHLLSIINELAENNAIISNIQYHWTTSANLMSIIRNGYLLGNSLLKSNNIFFEPNSLCRGDIQNGDHNVICFCPYLVDHDTIFDYNLKKIKSNLVRLSVNINHIKTQGKYNQFFKLRDLCSPDFDYDVKINEALSLGVSANNYRFTVIISFNENVKEIVLYESCYNNKNISEQHETIYYGNLTGINKFCLLEIFKLIDKAGDISFSNEFYSYLSSLDKNEIKKILVIFAQSLTVFAEYNFNATIKLTDHLISEIHYAHDAITLNLDNLSLEQYQFALNEIEDGNIPNLGLLTKKENIVEQKDGLLFIYGNEVDPILRNFDLTKQDFSTMPATYFASSQYIETRPSISKDSSPSFSLTL